MKKRVISAAVLISLVIVLYLIPTSIPFIACLGIVAVLGLKEILDLEESHQKLPLYIKLISYASLLFIILGKTSKENLILGIPFLELSIMSLLLLIPTIFEFNGRYTTKDAFYLIGAILALGLFFNVLVLIFVFNKWLLLYLILIATVTDTFAMLVGKLIGKHKLIPKVSPKKSVEGSVAGTIVAASIATIFYVNVLPNITNIGIVIVQSIILSILGQLGDLLFSKVKRENKIKDFSQIIPGHGGILDRFDSLVFIVLGYITILQIINLF